MIILSDIWIMRTFFDRFFCSYFLEYSKKMLFKFISFPFNMYINYTQIFTLLKYIGQAWHTPKITCSNIYFSQENYQSIFYGLIFYYLFFKCSCGLVIVKIGKRILLGYLLFGSIACHEICIILMNIEKKKQLYSSIIHRIICVIL